MLAPEEELINSIKQLSKQYQQKINELQIFQHFIDQENEFMEQYQEQDNQTHSVCGADIQENELKFKCFTCSSNSEHLFCKNCFIPEMHQGHKCIIADHLLRGVCDCGDEQFVNCEGFCPAHQGTKYEDQSEYQKKIPQKILNRTKQFIQAISYVFSQLMEGKRREFKQFPLIIFKIYHHSQMYKAQNIIECIEKAHDIKNCYFEFLQAKYLHSMLFKMLNFLIDQDFGFANLIASILNSKSIPQSNQSILEDIIENEVLIETYSLSPTEEFYGILLRLNIDNNFKYQVLNAYINKFESLWFIVLNIHTSLSKKLEQYYIEFTSLDTNFNIDQFCEFLQICFYQEKCSEQCQLNLFICERISEYQAQFFPYCLQMVYWNHNKIQNIYHQISKLQKYYYLPLRKQGYISFSFIFYSKLHHFKNNDFYKICFDQLSHIFSYNYQTLFIDEINQDILNNFPRNQFIFTQYLDAFKEVKQIQINVEELQNITNLEFDEQEDYLLISTLQIFILQNGLSKIFNSSLSNPDLQKNLTLILLSQCYSILKEEYQQIQISSQINKVILQLKQCEITDIPKSLTKSNFIFLKYNSTVERAFTFMFCHIYFLKIFSNGQQFFEYILKALNINLDTLKFILKELLERGLQTQFGINCEYNQNLENNYFNNTYSQDPTTMLASFDFSIVQIYLFMFEEQGLQDLITIINNKRTHLNNQINQTFFSILNRIIGSEIDMYNLYSPLFKELPKDLKSSFAKIIQNFFMISPTLHYQDIETMLKSMEIMISVNLNHHILQICEIDIITKKLKLQRQFRPIYEPAIFARNAKLKNQIIENLISQQKSDNMIHFGDGIQWDIEQFSKDTQRSMHHQFLRYFCKIEYIKMNLQELKDENNGLYLFDLFQIIYVQIVSANYFRQKEFIEEASWIIEEFQQLLNSRNKQKIVKLILAIISEIKSLIGEMNNQKNQKDHKLQVRFENKKQYFKNKFNKSTQSLNLLQILDQNNVENNNLKQNDLQICSICQLFLDEQQSVAIIYLFYKPKSQNFQNLPDKIQQILQKQKFDYTAIGMLSCQHRFHQQCLIQRFENKVNNIYDDIPLWMKLACPVCKCFSNIQFPIQKLITNLQIKQFNQELLLFLSEQSGNNKFEIDSDESSKIIKTYYNLFFDLLIQLYTNPQTFHRDQKFQIFNQLLIFLTKTDTEIFQQKENELQHYDQENILFQIIHLINQNIVIKKDIKQFQIQAENFLQNVYPQTNQIKLMIMQCLGLLDESNFLQLQEQHSISLIEDKTLKEFQNLNVNIQNQIIQVLGLNFKQFHDKYFSQKCMNCKSYNLKINGEGDLLVCILCCKTFCNIKCTKQINLNLFNHACQEHSGSSIYISLQTGYASVVSNPFITHNYKCLFYNKLGQKVNVFNMNQDWNEFELDLYGAQTLSQLIFDYCYHNVTRNLVLN